MSKPFTVKTRTILGGISPLISFGQKGSYISSVGIDPDFPIDDSSVRPSGYLRPTALAKFSGSNVNAAPLWIVTNPKDTNTYSYLSNGKLISYDSSLASETALGSTFTVTLASPAVFTLNAHGLALNDTVLFTTTGALPTGLSANTVYYVISAGLTLNAFEVSATQGGSAVNTSVSQSGTHTAFIGAGNGLAYYDNYLYLARRRNISRYGPLNGSPAFTNAYWITTLGKATLTDTTYPSINGVMMPNHVMHRHTDNYLYICDVLSDSTVNTNLGGIHRIGTTKTTVEGDTTGVSNPPAYNALDLPYGMYPTTLESYQTNLAVALIEGTSVVARQKNAKMTFWDTTSTSFSLITEDEFPDPLITALLNVNGILYVASGSATGGCRISRYTGGYTHEELWYNEDCFPPLQGAFAHLLNQVVFGTAVTYPSAYPVVMALGSKNAKLGRAVHGILKGTGTGTTPYVTALAYVQNSAFPRLSPIVGSTDGTGSQIDKLSTTYGTSVWRSEMFQVGQPGQVQQVFIPLGAALAANITITAKIFVDDGSASTTLFTINTTNFGTQRSVNLMQRKVNFDHNFFLELTWSGTVLCPVALPIVYKGVTTSEING